MLIHYVEDDELDAQIMKRLVARHLRSDVQVSKSIDDLATSLMEQPVDCVLLDVNRPDARSLDHDVREVRDHTDAPIIFITGSDTEQVRADAFRAGADYIINKNNLSPALLRDVFENIRAKLNVSLPPEIDAGKDEISTEEELQQPHLLANYNLEQLDAPLEYLRTSLDTLTEVMQDNGFYVSSGLLHQLTEVTDTISAFAKSDLTTSDKISLSAALDYIRPRLNAIADHKNIRLVMEAEDVAFSQIGPGTLAGLGLQHLFEGLLRAAQPSTSFVVYAGKYETGVQLVMHFSKQVLPGIETLFPKAPQSSVVGMDALALLRLGALLLYLRPEQISMQQDDGSQSITITL
ncbi:MAG: response regulator [Aquisalinus sp.]|nr:response regulator [Aquisalinus sp.]